MIVGKKIYDICFTFFYPTTLATAYGQKPKVVRAKQSATVEGENCTYGPTLQNWLNVKCFSKDEKLVLKSSLFCIAIANIIHRDYLLLEPKNQNQFWTY